MIWRDRRHIPPHPATWILGGPGYWTRTGWHMSSRKQHKGG